MDAYTERERTRQKFFALCAGLVTSAIYNVNRKKGARLLTPKDFVKDRDEKVHVIPKKAFFAQLSAWASSHNRAVMRSDQLQRPDF